MSSSRFYSPENAGRTTAIYKRAFRELKIERASGVKHERLDRRIFFLDNTTNDPHRFLDKAICRYLRLPTLNHRL
jgi:hypothetical protein